MSRRLLCAIGVHEYRWPAHWQMPPGSTLYFGRTFAAVCRRPGCGGRAVFFCSPDSHFRERHPEEAGAATASEGDPRP